jgi:hypothetical protein
MVVGGKVEDGKGMDYGSFLYAKFFFCDLTGHGFLFCPKAPVVFILRTKGMYPGSFLNPIFLDFTGHALLFCPRVPGVFIRRT